MQDEKDIDRASIVIDEFGTAEIYCSWGAQAENIRKISAKYARENPGNKHLPRVSKQAAELVKAIKGALGENTPLKF